MSNDQQPDQPQQPPYEQAGAGATDGQAPRQPLPGHPQTPSHQAAIARPRGSRAGLAWAGIALAVVAVLVGPFLSAGVAAAFQAGTIDVAAYGAMSAMLHAAVVGGLALVGLILSCVALTGTKRVLTGIGIGANAILLLGFVASLALTPLAYAFM